MRYITADTHLDHDTIAHFRKRFLGELEGLFVQILGVARELGVLRVGTVSLDGTKVQANASKHKAMSWGYAQRLEEQLREEVGTLMERADAEAVSGLDIPEELERREARLAAIERAKAELERRGQERYEAERAEYEEKVARRRAKEEATGRKAGGREPKAPEPGPAGEGPGELHRRGVAHHAVCARVRAGLQRAGGGRCGHASGRGRARERQGERQAGVGAGAGATGCGGGGGGSAAGAAGRCGVYGARGTSSVARLRESRLTLPVVGSGTMCRWRRGPGRRRRPMVARRAKVWRG